MSGKFRIDFSIRELDVPEESARGVRFGDDVELAHMPDFFNKCRDAVRSLFQPLQRQTYEELMQEMKKLKDEQIELRRKEQMQQHVNQMRRLVDPGTGKVCTSEPQNLSRFGDDGSRGGDGPASPEWLAKVASAINPDRERY